MARYINVVLNGFYLIYIERLISTACHFFSYFDEPINCKSWVCKLHNIFLTYSETEAAFILRAFSIVV